MDITASRRQRVDFGNVRTLGVSLVEVSQTPKGLKQKRTAELNVKTDVILTGTHGTAHPSLDTGLIKSVVLTESRTESYCTRKINTLS